MTLVACWEVCRDYAFACFGGSVIYIASVLFLKVGLLAAIVVAKMLRTPWH